MLIAFGSDQDELQIIIMERTLDGPNDFPRSIVPAASEGPCAAAQADVNAVANNAGHGPPQQDDSDDKEQRAKDTPKKGKRPGEQAQDKEGRQEETGRHATAPAECVQLFFQRDENQASC